MSDPTVNSLLAVSDGLFLVFDESGELCDWNQTVVERTAANPESLSTMPPTISSPRSPTPTGGSYR